MKWPWRKLEDKIAKAIVNLKTMMEAQIKKAVEVQHSVIMGQMHIFKASEQIKFNRLERRIQNLEGCCEEQLKQHHKKIYDREIAAAREIDKCD